MGMGPRLAPIERDLALVEQILTGEVDSSTELICRIAGYALKSKGKRIRPALLLLSARICGYRDGLRHVRLAAISEFLHVAALIHDDIIDNSDMRRGRPSANFQWGNGLSVLVGDYLYSRSVKHLVEDEDLEIMRAFTEATLRMVEGEVLQREMTERGDASLEQYMRMMSYKTASLFSACCRVGALIARAPQEDIDALTQYGSELGIAFQIMDDTLDFLADAKVLGKPVGQDLREGRITFPLYRILEEGAPSEKNLLRHFAEEKEMREEIVKEILSLLERYQGLEWAKGIAHDQVEKAKGHLAPFPPSESKETLLDLADYILLRER